MYLVSSNTDSTSTISQRRAMNREFLRQLSMQQLALELRAMAIFSIEDVYLRESSRRQKDRSEISITSLISKLAEHQTKKHQTINH
jgi:hypothetical protein